MEGLGSIRQVRSAGRMSQRTNSSTTVSSIDDNISLSSSSYTSSFKRSYYASKTSNVDYSGVRAAAGISRMKNGRRKGSMFPSDGNGSESSSAKSHRLSIYSLSELAEVGIKMRRRRRSTMDSWGKNRTPGETEYFDKLLPPAELFRRAVKLVQMSASLCQYKYEKENDEENLAHTVFHTMRVSAEVKVILSVHPEQRTEQQLAKVQFSLRSIRSFAEYPQRIQQKLVKVGWYETHQTKRAILRQGHIPQAFYFVLSGSAVVTVMAENESFARTVHFLRRGDSFGELAILHDTRRQSTVISREPIELLVISKEDFVDIFMLAGGIKNINDPDQQKFMNNIDFLRGWPVELMASNPKKCLFHFFRSGSVLVRDSNHSDWIYIIKSGSCQVLKKLREVKSRLTQHNDRVVGFENVKSQVPKASSRSRMERVRAKLSVVTLLLPKLHHRPGLITQESDNDDDSGNEAKTSDVLAIDKVAAAQKLFATSSDNNNRSSPEEKSVKSVGFRAASPPSGRRSGVVSAPKSSLRNSTNEQSKNLKNMIDSRRKLSSEPGLISRSSQANVIEDGQSRKLSSSELPRRLQKRMTPDDRERSSNKMPLPTVEEETTSASPISTPPRQRFSSLHADYIEHDQRPRSDSNARPRSLSTNTTRRTSRVSRKSTVTSPAAELSEEEKNLPLHKISVIDEGEQRPTEVRITDADLHPMFVQVALLSKGDSFGVSSMVFDEQPSLSLVSNGAECIMISKKFYLAHCSDEMKRRLLVTETPYPNDESLQKSLQDKVNWDAYRRKTLKTLVRELPTKQRRMKDLLVHRRTKPDMSLGEDLKEAIRKIQRKDDDT
ncbi:hypothetical protein OS493_003255 [Desmophyllum pertusum]|uniref:Cyclic nucleotide-binding domain-containing protein n=1 Tax=Desmophyllum pertusum TaxID=174260 RepID=A0A9W9YK61_9CNID|nr:hypothetical protein OS493_003255 [Desmophyllum pertusum]